MIWTCEKGAGITFANLTAEPITPTAIEVYQFLKPTPVAGLKLGDLVTWEVPLHIP